MTNDTLKHDYALKTQGYSTNYREYYFRTSTKFNLSLLETEFSQFLSPHPLVQTSGRTLTEPLLGVIAEWQGKAAGLVVVEKRPDQRGLVICWHVNKNHYGFGLGSKLIRQIELLAIDNDLHTLILTFRGDSSFRPQITKILHFHGWPPLQ